MPDMRLSLLFVACAVAGCVSQPELPSSRDTTADASSSGAPPQTEASGSTAQTTGQPGSSEGHEGSETGAGEADASSGGCAQDCDADSPTLLWNVESDDTYGDGSCLGIVEDGQGGLFASYIGYGFDAYSDVIAVNASGDVTAKGRGAQAGPYIGFAPRGPGLFDWAAGSGHVGIADTTLQNLDGGLLTNDVVRIRAMASDDPAPHYVVQSSQGFGCRIRTGPDPSSDSIPFDCAPNFSPESLVVDDAGNRYYAEPRAYRIQRIDPAGLLYGDVDGRWNRVGFDIAVDPEGSVWVVGGLGSEGGELFGSFIARHAFDLGDDPLWEEAEEGDVLWTTITITADGPVVFGHEGFGEHLHARGLGLQGELLWSWSQEAPPQTYLDAVTVDAQGDLLVCGTRYAGTQTPVGDDVHHPVFYKFSFQG